MSRPFVIDASVLLAAVLGDEPTSAVALAAVRQLTKRQGLVPGLWSSEVGNVLLTRARKGRLTARQVDELLAGFEALPLQVDDQGLGAALATLDDDLATAAEEEGLELVVSRR